VPASDGLDELVSNLAKVELLSEDEAERVLGEENS